ncbi:MAG: hypothetical protein ACPKQO_08035 [Nitrososphaeraceae archaeon]
MASPAFIFFMSLISGLWGFYGVGHLYLGKKRWILIMITGWVILIFIVLMIFPILTSIVPLAINQIYYPNFNFINQEFDMYIVIVGLYLFINLIQSFDAYRLSRKDRNSNNIHNNLQK